MEKKLLIVCCNEFSQSWDFKSSNLLASVGVPGAELFVAVDVGVDVIIDVGVDVGSDVGVGCVCIDVDDVGAGGLS